MLLCALCLLLLQQTTSITDLPKQYDIVYPKVATPDPVSLFIVYPKVATPDPVSLFIVYPKVATPDPVSLFASHFKHFIVHNLFS